MLQSVSFYLLLITKFYFNLYSLNLLQGALIRRIFFVKEVNIFFVILYWPTQPWWVFNIMIWIHKMLLVYTIVCLHPYRKHRRNLRQMTLIYFRGFICQNKWMIISFHLAVTLKLIIFFNVLRKRYT